MKKLLFLATLTLIMSSCIEEKKELSNAELFAKIDAEIKYTQGFLAAVEKKLSNERFVNNAPPQVIELERKKAADAKSKIVILEKNRKAL
mgnify:CR=1 FL=1